MLGDLRDQFAGLIAAGLVADDRKRPEAIAQRAYQIADALMAERPKHGLASKAAREATERANAPPEPVRGI